MTGLKHGPLSEGMVPMLTPGRSFVRCREWDALAIVEAIAPGEGCVEVILDGKSCWFPASSYRYIGERDDDGWIAAPPGGWAENPVPGRRVTATYRHGCTTTSTVGSSEKVWWDAAIAFRLVEEATPVGGGLGALREQARSVPTEPAADRWADLERLATKCTEGDPWYSADDLRGRQTFGQFLSQDRAFIAAANPATVLELTAAARAATAGCEPKANAPEPERSPDMVLVPREPTDAILRAWDAYRHNASGVVAWRAMIATARAKEAGE